MHPSVRRTNVCHFLRKSACNLQRSSQPISSQSHKACFINASHGYKTQVKFSYVLTFAMPLLLWVSSVKHLFSILAPLQSRRVLTHIETSSNKMWFLIILPPLLWYVFFLWVPMFESLQISVQIDHPFFFLNHSLLFNSRVYFFMARVKSVSIAFIIISDYFFFAYHV